MGGRTTRARSSLEVGVAIRRTQRDEKSPAHDDHEELGRPVHRHVAEPSIPWPANTLDGAAIPWPAGVVRRRGAHALEKAGKLHGDDKKSQDRIFPWSMPFLPPPTLSRPDEGRVSVSERERRRL